MTPEVIKTLIEIANGQQRVIYTLVWTFLRQSQEALQIYVRDWLTKVKTAGSQHRRLGARAAGPHCTEES